MQYEIICTFNKYEQIVLTLYYNSDISEKNFINEIFNMLKINELKHLVKLSCCQLYTFSFTKLLPFIQKNNGKYYFNIDINKDPETKYWNDFRNEYLKKRIKNNRINKFIGLTILIGSISFIGNKVFNRKKFVNQKPIKYDDRNNKKESIYKSNQLQMRQYPYYTPWDIIIS